MLIKNGVYSTQPTNAFYAHHSPLIYHDGRKNIELKEVIESA
jgi:hypothetical protein